VLATVAIGAPLFGATFTVTSANDSGSGTLRAALTSAAASSGPHLIDATTTSGKIALASPLPPVTQDVTITGPGMTGLSIGRAAFEPTLSTTWITPILDSIFEVQAGATLRLKHLWVTDDRFLEWHLVVSLAGATTVIEECRLERTSGIQSWGSLTVRDCIVRRNTSSCFIRSSGAVANLTCERTLFEENASNPTDPTPNFLVTASVIGVGQHPALIDDCVFSGNFTPGYGAVASWGTLVIKDSVFRDNAIDAKIFWDGAALTVFANSASAVPASLVCERCTFERNRGARGGAVALRNCLANFRDCTFSGNRVQHPDAVGGAMYAMNSVVSLHNCTFSGNQAGSATGKGGAIYFESATGTQAPAGIRELVYCTITDNDARGGGGGG
jgi:predicted outer membrane repeat protein